VKALPAIARLLHLRRRREHRALEAATAEMQGLSRAERAVEAAAAALRQHDELTESREQALLAPLVGLAVPRSSIVRMRGALDVLAVERVSLEAEASNAEAALHRQREALEVARAAFFRQRRAAIKIDRLFAREAARHALRDEVMAEDGEYPARAPAVRRSHDA
jgi:hypothetical protein